MRSIVWWALGLLLLLSACKDDNLRMFASCEADAECGKIESCVEGVCRPNCVIDIDCGSDAYCYEFSCYYYSAERKEDSQCVTYEDCRTGFVCVDGVCREGCTEDKHCDENQHCVENPDGNLGVCRECGSDTDCKIHHICRENHCIFKCFIDEHCSESSFGHACNTESGRCVECVSSDSCRENQKCEDNVCVDMDLKCNDSKDCPLEFPVCWANGQRCVKCLSKFDCNDGEYCINHQCERVCKYRTDCFNEQYCYTAGDNYGICVDCYEDSQCPANSECFAFSCYQKSCEEDTDCDARGFCHPTEKVCYTIPAGGCEDNWDCPQHRVVCDPYTHNRCLRQCIMGCFDDEPYCDDSIQFPACFECLEDSHCDTRCLKNDKKCAPCGQFEPCRGDKKYCDYDSGECHYCLDDSNCDNDYRCTEGNDGFYCVECVSDNDCKTEEKPFCGKDHSCIEPCENECEEGQIKCKESEYYYSLNPYYQYCTDYDNDYCREWSVSYRSCAGSKKCFEGSCQCFNECEIGDEWCALDDYTSRYYCVESGGCNQKASQVCIPGNHCQSGECVSDLSK